MSKAPQPLIEMWFFRDLSDEQRYKLGVLCGLPGEAWPVSHVQQRVILRHILARLRAAPPSLPDGWKAVPVEPTHRHKKRGTEYVLIGYGKMQAEHWQERDGDKRAFRTRGNPPLYRSIDMREVAIYRSVTDPTEIWVRPREEFEDGRFEALSALGAGQ